MNLYEAVATILKHTKNAEDTGFQEIAANLLRDKHPKPGFSLESVTHNPATNKLRGRFSRAYNEEEFNNAMNTDPNWDEDAYMNHEEDLQEALDVLDELLKR